MNSAKKLLLKTSERLELPSDILVGIPRIEMLGRGKCTIEPQKGLLEYSEKRICVATELGKVHVFGDDMRIKEMNACRIVISGKLEKIDFAEEAHV